MTQPSTSRRVALATTLLLVSVTAAACGHSSPAAPDAVTTSTDAAAVAPSETIAAKPTPSSSDTFPLLAGTFTIANRKGAQISGVYTGETIEGGGVSTTTLRLEVQGGTGSLAGASGILEGKGQGAFTGEGDFLLDVSGTLATSGKKAKFNASLQGASHIACDGGHVIITLNADGRGTISSGEMRHEVANAGCGF